MRTAPSGRPRMASSSARSMCGDCVVTCTCDAVADTLGGPGLGLDVGVLDEPGLEDAVDDRRRRSRTPRRDHRSPRGPEPARCPRVPRAPSGRRARAPRRAPSSGGSSVHDTGNESRSSAAIGRRLADHHRDGLPSEPRLHLREDRLVGGRRDHAEAVHAGHVGGGHHCHHARRRLDEGIEVAELEPGPMVRRTHDPDHERPLGPVVGPEYGRCRAPSVRRRPVRRDTRPPCRPAAAPRRPRSRARPSPPTRSCGSRCIGTARRRGRRGPAARSGPAPGATARRPPPACRVCRCRTERRHGRGTRAGAPRPPRASCSPSRVSTALPSSRPTAVMQALSGAPSTSTVHAPQSPASQPTFVAVSPRSSRSSSLSRRADGSARTADPFTCERHRAAHRPSTQRSSARRTSTDAASRR